MNKNLSKRIFRPRYSHSRRIPVVAYSLFNPYFLDLLQQIIAEFTNPLVFYCVFCRSSWRVFDNVVYVLRFSVAYV